MYLYNVIFILASYSNCLFCFRQNCRISEDNGCVHTRISSRYSLNIPLAILQKSLDRALFYTFLYTGFDRVAIELLSQLCTFENSTECSKISFDSDSLQNS